MRDENTVPSLLPLRIVCAFGTPVFLLFAIACDHYTLAVCATPPSLLFYLDFERRLLRALAFIASYYIKKGVCREANQI